MQFFSSVSRLISFKPVKLLHSSPLQAALFATTSKNKQIIDKYAQNVQKEMTPDSKQDFLAKNVPENRKILRTRNVYSEKDQEFREIPITSAKELKREAIIDNETSLSLETSKKVTKSTSENKEALPAERLSKRLSRLGVCSRRQAERMIETGLVLVNGRKVDSNVPVTIKDKVSIFTKHGERIPMKEETKVWVFNKPKGLICTHDDPQKRTTIFEYLKASGFEGEHFISVVMS